ncbi:MAG: LacI family DNA-binding transcriptional regulator [Clostridiales bacterium]|nr:LacI family DNA-binding transcriptional regulator [Clostridiales bacterium]
MNINEIAKLAGVSRATVSRYLNDGYVSEEKRESIRRVIEETGYQPSSQAQMLRTKKTKLAGVILPKINSHTVSRMVEGISEVLSKSGYGLLLANTANDRNEELKYLEIFRDNQVDGIILIATIFTTRHKKLLKECRVPVVILGQYLKGFSCVYHEDFQAAGQMMKTLMEHGKIPGYIGVTTKDEAVGRNRREGVENALRELGISWKDGQFAEGDFRIESGYQKMKEILETEPEVDTVLCATDNIAAGAMLYLRECGKSIPQDIQIAGMDDTPVCRIVTPALATVHLHYKTCGREAAKILVEQMEEEHAVCRELKIGFELVMAESIRK